MPRRSRRTGSLLAVAWVAGTVTAVLISIVSINLAGSKVTARPISTVSKSGVEQALAGDATVLVRDPGSEVASDDLTTDDQGGSGSVSDDSSASGSGDRSGSGGSSTGSGSGDEGGPSGGSGSGGGGSGDDGGSGGSGGGGSGDSGSTTTTEHEQERTTTTTAAPSSPVSRTVSGNTVTVRCTGDTIALVSVTAASGFSKEIDKSGPDEVNVQFVNQQTDAEVEIQARCSHGSASWD